MEPESIDPEVIPNGEHVPRGRSGTVVRRATSYLSKKTPLPVKIGVVAVGLIMLPLIVIFMLMAAIIVLMSLLSARLAGRKTGSTVRVWRYKG